MCMQAHDSAGGIGSVVGALAGKAVVAAQETTGAIKEKVRSSSFCQSHIEKQCCHVHSAQYYVTSTGG